MKYIDDRINLAFLLELYSNMIHKYQNRKENKRIAFD